ncbi:MAG TPA: peptidylprolyl isomerase [Pseudomonadales bacterium]
MIALKDRCVRRSAALAVLVSVALGAGSTLAAEDNPRVRLQTTLGPIEVELFEAEAPQTVANFLKLVDQDFYDGLIFHRVIAGFMVQAGGYDAGMNYREAPNTVPNESDNGLKNTVGTLAMARLSDPDSAGAQFYINVEDNEHLNARPGQPGYTVFGRVVEGMDVVTEIELAETTRKAGMPDVPKVPIVIEDIERL